MSTNAVNMRKGWRLDIGFGSNTEFNDSFYEGYENPLCIPTHSQSGSYSQAFALKNRGRTGRALRKFKKLLGCFAPESAEYVEVLRQIAVCLRLQGGLRAASRKFHEAYYKALVVHDDLAIAVLLDWSAVLLDTKQSLVAIELLEDMDARLAETHPKRLQLEGYLGRTYMRTDDPELQVQGRDQVLEVCRRLEGQEGMEALLVDMTIYPLELFDWPGSDGAEERWRHYEEALELVQGSFIRTLQVRICYHTGARWLRRMNVCHGVVSRLRSVLPG